jgi:hypothetical protein
MAWYVIVLIVASALFLLSTIGSVFLGDMDADWSTSSGFLMSDLLSFKGFTHFTIGFSLVLTLMQGLSLVSAGVGVVTGIVFMAVLYYLYKFFFEKLQQSMKYTNEIKEMDAEIYFWDAQSKIGEVFIILEGRPVTVTLKCPDGISLTKGQKIKVSGNRHAVYPIV